MALQNPIETAVGAGVLALAIGFGFYASQADTAGAATGGYEVFAKFRSADGVVAGADVRIGGVKVGAVTGLELDPDSHRAKVSMEIRDGVVLSDETLAKIDREGLLGGVYVSLDSGAGFSELADGDEISNTQPSLSFTELMVKFAGGRGGDKHCPEQ